MKHHPARFLALVAETRKRIKEISPRELKKKLDEQDPFYLVDVREDEEWASGHLPNAMHISKGIIERDIENTVNDLEAPIVVYCSGGFRCILVADSLQNMGYSNVQSLEGGLQNWLAMGYEVK